MARNIGAEIETACARRRAAWAVGDTDTATRMSDRLAALYEEKRTGVASHGSKAGRERAVKRARVEQELDRLMQP